MQKQVDNPTRIEKEMKKERGKMNRKGTKQENKIIWQQSQTTPIPANTASSRNRLIGETMNNLGINGKERLEKMNLWTFIEKVTRPMTLYRKR